MAQRITSIDCLRGIAALVVLVWHFQIYFDSRPAASLFAPFYANGQIAVDTFFVISGFTLAYVYRCRVDNFSAFSAYVWRRFARMYPLHLTALMLTALIFLGFYETRGSYGFIYQDNNLYHLALNLGLLQYVGLQTDYAFNAPSWSISTEFWVNIGFGLLLVCQPKSLVRVSGLIVALSAGVLVFVAGTWSDFVLVAGTWSNGPKIGGWLEVNLLRTLCGFFAGVLVHEFWRSRPIWSAKAGTAALASGTVALLAAMTFPRTMSGNVYIEMVAALFASTILVWGCATAPVARNIGDSRLGKWIGEISYSIYMWHFPVAALCVLAGAIDAFGSGVLLFATYVGITLGVATMSNRHLERPSRAFLIGMTGSQSRRQAMAS